MRKLAIFALILAGCIAPEADGWANCEPPACIESGNEIGINKLLFLSDDFERAGNDKGFRWFGEGADTIWFEDLADSTLTVVYGPNFRLQFFFCSTIFCERRFMDTIPPGWTRWEQRLLYRDTIQ